MKPFFINYIINNKITQTMKKITLLAMSLMMTLFVKAQNGTDVTSLLSDPDFESSASGWNIVGGNKIAATAANYGYNGTSFIENWVAAPSTLGDQSWSQTIEVPNGVYAIKSMAHAVLQSDASVVPSGVAIYANKDEVAVTTTHTNPPAEYSLVTVVTDGKLTVGYRITSCNINWAAWDNVRVTQYIADTEEQAKFLWMQDELAAIMPTIKALLGEHMQASLSAALTASLDAIAEVADFAAANALMESIKTQMADAEKSIEAYKALLAAIEAADRELSEGYPEGVDEFEAAVGVATSYYDDAAGDVEATMAVIAQLNEDIFTYQMLNADGTVGFDVTDKFMTNASMRKGNQGWSGSAPGLEHEVMEFYQSDFDMYQTLTDVPNGMYVVKVQGFYRVGANDSGAAYQAGTENITAQLYANEAAVPLLSLYKYTASEMGVTNDQVLNDYVNMRVSTNEAFNLTNPATGELYYSENEVTVFVADGKLTIGLRNVGHLSTSWCAFREFKLIYYGNFPGVVLAGNIAKAEAWLEENSEFLPEAAVMQLNDAIYDADEYTDPGLDEAEVQAAIAAFDAAFASVKNVVTLFEELSAKLEKAAALIDLAYPGLDDFVVAYTAADEICSAGAKLEIPEDQTTEEYLKEVIAAFDAAIAAYYQSQVASRENPADYTFLMPNPNFEQKGNWTWHVTGGGTDQWNGGCRPNEEGGSNRQGVNLWGWGISSIDVHQELTNLPNGLYKVSAELITQAGYATDQHVYAKGISTVTSEYLTEEGWDSYVWQELTTTDCAVVIDGKLTIGAAASQGGTNSEGWFQATNFKLYYCGEASAEDLKAAWELSLGHANEMATVLLSGDSKAVKDAIASASLLAAEDKYVEACQALNPAVAASDSIFNVSQQFFAGNYQALIDLGAELDATVNAYSIQVLGAVVPMADALLKAEDATHKILDPLDAKLAGYVDYVTYLLEAESTLATIKGVKDEYKAVAKGIIELQVADLVAELRPAADCADLLAKLKKVVLALGSFNFLNLPVGDLTEDLIVNYDIEADANASGWTVVKGDAQNAPTNSGEHYDNRTQSSRYLDAWNPNVGVNNITIYQEIVGLPDGTYQLTVATRTDGDNVYVFASPEALEADTAKWTAATQWDMVKNYGAFGGEIYAADTLLWHELNGVGEFPYMDARNGDGYGWSYNTVKVQVTNHYLMIGITANQLLTGQAQFTGTWLGADDWKLVLVEKAAVQSELNPFNGIENLEAAPVKMGTYDLFGRRIDTPTATGIYIVNGKKVFIKK